MAHYGHAEIIFFDPYFNRFTLTTLPNLAVVELKVPTFFVVLIDKNELITPGRFRLGFLRGDEPCHPLRDAGSSPVGSAKVESAPHRRASVFTWRDRGWVRIIRIEPSNAGVLP